MVRERVHADSDVKREMKEALKEARRTGDQRVSKATVDKKLVWDTMGILATMEHARGKSELDTGFEAKMRLSYGNRGRKKVPRGRRKH